MLSPNNIEAEGADPEEGHGMVDPTVNNSTPERQLAGLATGSAKTCGGL